MGMNTIKINNQDADYTHSIFDITEYNLGQSYEDLSEALQGIPQDKQIPGMTVRFILTSDNKYVQYRYIGTSAANVDFTNISYWQSLDGELYGYTIYDNVINVTGSTLNVEVLCNFEDGEVFDINAVSSGTFTWYVRLHKDDNTYDEITCDSRNNYSCIERIIADGNIVKIQFITYSAVSGNTITAKISTDGVYDYIKNMESTISDLTFDAGITLYDETIQVSSSNVNVEIPYFIPSDKKIHVNIDTHGYGTYYINFYKKDGTHITKNVIGGRFDDILTFDSNIVKIKISSNNAVSGTYIDVYVRVISENDEIRRLDSDIIDIKNEIGTIIYDGTVQVYSSTLNVDIPCHISAGTVVHANLNVVGGTYSLYIRFYKEDNTYIEKQASQGKFAEDIELTADIVKVNIITFSAVSGTQANVRIKTVGVADVLNDVILLDSINAFKTIPVTNGGNVNLKFSGTFKAGQKLNIKLSSNAFSNIVLSSLNSYDETVETFVTIGNRLDFDITLSYDAQALAFIGLASDTTDITVAIGKYNDDIYVKKEYSSSLYRPEFNEKNKVINASGNVVASYVQDTYEVTDYIDFSDIETLTAVGCRYEEGTVAFATYDNSKNPIRTGIATSIAAPIATATVTRAVGEKYIRFCLLIHLSKKNISVGSTAAKHIETYTEHYYLFDRMFDLYARPCVSLISDDFAYGNEDHAGYGRTTAEQQEAFKNALLDAGLTCDVAVSYNSLYTDEKRTIMHNWEKQGFQLIFHPQHEYWYPTAPGGVDLDIARTRLIDDIVNTRREFPSRLRVFVYPGDSDTVPEVVEMIKEYFDCGITWRNGANWQRPYSDGPNRYKIWRFNLQIGVKGTQTMAEMKASIDEAVSEKAWIIFGMHPHWLDLDGVEPTNPEKFTIANMMEIINYALTATGTSKLVHTEEEWERRKPLYDFLGI